MNFRKAQPEDFIYIRDNALYPYQNDKEPLETIFHDFTFEHDAIILGSGGFQILTDSTAQCYVQLTKFATQPVIQNLCTMAETMRRIKEYIEIFCETHNILRLQAWVDCDFEEGKRLVDHLGFHKEVRMKDYLGKGKDAYLYVRFMEIE